VPGVAVRRDLASPPVAFPMSGVCWSPNRLPRVAGRSLSLHRWSFRHPRGLLRKARSLWGLSLSFQRLVRKHRASEGHSCVQADRRASPTIGISHESPVPVGNAIPSPDQEVRLEALERQYALPRRHGECRQGDGSDVTARTTSNTSAERGRTRPSEGCSKNLGVNRWTFAPVLLRRNSAAALLQNQLIVARGGGQARLLELSTPSR